MRDDQSFDAFALAYDRFCGSIHQPLLPWLTEQGIPHTGRALDLGCGSGRTVAELATAFDEVVGVDLSQPLLDLAAARRPANVTYVRGDLATYSDPHGEGFELVFSSTALHHVDDLDAALANVAALVKPGGWAVLRDVVRLDNPRLVWIWRHGGFVIGPVTDTLRRRNTWADLRFQLSPPWVRHLLADRWLTAGEFAQRYRAAFPCGLVERRPGELTTLRWQKPQH